jgi:hypothetical protein
MKRYSGDVSGSKNISWKSSESAKIGAQNSWFLLQDNAPAHQEVPCPAQSDDFGASAKFP